MTAAEVLVTLTLAGLATGIGAPVATRFMDNLRLDAAARSLATELHTARMRAITSGSHAGMVLKTGAEGGSWRHYRDGGVRGIRSLEIASGVDRPVGMETMVAADHPGVRFGLPHLPIPRVPPSAGILQPSSDPVALGTTDIFSASPRGGTTSGTIYLTDGERVRALVIYGPTGRLKLWKYDPEQGKWRLMG